MATLADRLDTDFKTALKAQDRLRMDTLRMIKAAGQRVAIDKRKDRLDDEEVTQILNQQAKLRRETIEAGRKTNRADVVTQSETELAIITAYLPQAISREEVAKLVDEAITSVGPNQGPIMKFVMAKAKGAADGKLVSEVVAARLKPGS